MSDDDIKPGDRFERIDTWSEWKAGDIAVARCRSLDGYQWTVEGSDKNWLLSNPEYWRRLPRIEAPWRSAKVGCDGCFGYEAAHEPACERTPPLAPARCKSPCTPLNPCRTPVVCPVFHEENVDDCIRIYAEPGDDADVLPPARASSYVPRCAELAGWGSWDGRQRKQ